MTGAKADGSEALKAAFAGVLIREYGACDDGEEAQAWLAAEHLLPFVLAYGREQATREAEQALRDAASEVAEMEWDERPHEIADWLGWRADDLGRQT